MAKKPKKLFGKETVQGMKEVKNLSKVVDEMASKYDDLNATQQKNVDWNIVGNLKPSPQFDLKNQSFPKS